MREKKMRASAGRRLLETKHKFKDAEYQWLVQYKAINSDHSPKLIGDTEYIDAVREALSIKPSDKAALSAFEAYGLNKDNLLHFRELFDSIVQIQYGERKRGGRAREWSSERRAELVAMVKELVAKKLSVRAACAFLAKSKSSPPHFRKAGASGLRNQLRSARIESEAAISRQSSDKKR